MSASFAGSRFLDARRRRRLATESDDATIEQDRPAASELTVSALGEGTSQQSPDAQFPLRKVISHRLWKLWAVAFLGLSLGAGLLYGGLHVAEVGEKLGPGFARLFNLSGGPVFRCYRSILLILSGELALLIFWSRSRSQQDFAGRYRLWGWVACAWFWFAFCTASGAHYAWSESVLWMWDVPLRNRETLCWLVPAAAIGVELLWLLHRDMRDCRSSLLLLWLSAGLLATVGVKTLLADVQWHEVVTPAVAMGGVLCLFTSMLLHARHVIYQTAEPPELRPFRLPIRLPRLRMPRLRLRSEKRTRSKPTSNAEKAKPQPAVAKTKTPPAAAKAKAPARPVPQTSEAPAAEPEPAPAPAPASEPQAEFAAEQPARRRKPKQNRKSAEPTEPARQIRIDQPPDPEMLKGLSKRERRRLRKQWREQQRVEMD